jgi:molecular chaperone HtpG
VALEKSARLPKIAGLAKRIYARWKTSMPANDTPAASAAQAADRQTHGFQAEVRELLKLMIHSLYSHREIFLRELISNASDACDRLRFAAIADGALLAEDPELGIRVEADAAAGTVTITDNGIGMTREEAIANLGTIARSGTREFFRSLSGDAQKASALIGQFGVGFYSAFIVADRVEVRSRKAGAAPEAGVRWESGADGDFTVETVTQAPRGTAVTLHLKADAREFADPMSLRALIRRYSDHIGFAVRMRKGEPPEAASARAGMRGPEARPGTDTSEGEASLEYEVVNQAKALWTLPRAEIKDEEYREFYQYLAHDFTDPLAWSHNKVEGKREYTSLLYLPARAPFDLWQRDAARGLKLYVRRVFIMDDAEQFLPLYLRFVKGVVDSSDLPLNVSREILQQEPEVEAIRAGLTRRVLELLARLAKDEPEKYATFWKEFGAVLKEGLAQDHANQAAILPLLRFASTHAADNAPQVSLADYVARMKTGQDRIYYVIAESLEAARGSPAIERLKERGLEVLLLAERIDEWVMGQLESFEGKRFKDASRGDLELGGLASDADRKQHESELKESKGLLKRIKDALGERVTEVRVSERLKESPACLVLGEHDLSEQMRRILAAAGQKAPDARPRLEVNVAHPLVKYLDGVADAGQFSELAQLLFDQAALAEGVSLSNPPEYVQRLNRLLVRLAAPVGGAGATAAP